MTAEEGVLFERFSRRAATGERHPSHNDGLMTREEITTLLREGRWGTLEVGGTLVEVDTTDFGRVDYNRVLATIRATI